MLKIYRRDRDQFWKVRGTLHGVRYEKSTGVSSKREAQLLCDAWAAEINKRHVEEAVLGRRPAPSFAEAVCNYVEGGGEARFLGPLLEYFGERRCDQITQECVDEAARKILPGRAPATINRQITTPLSAVLKCARVSIELERRKEPPGRIRFLEPDEARRLVNACGPHLKPIVAFLFGTGARAGEALFLDWSNVDLARGHVAFPKTKNGLPRGVPLLIGPQ